MAEGKKFDQGKAPITLIPAIAIAGMAQVFGFGAKKYGRHNFREGIAYSRLLDAAHRHLLAYQEGEDMDPESGFPHWAHALCCLSMLAFMTTKEGKWDDRYHSRSSQDSGNKASIAICNLHDGNESNKRGES